MLQRLIEGVRQMPLPQLDRAVVASKARVAGAPTLRQVPRPEQCRVQVVTPSRSLSHPSPSKPTWHLHTSGEWLRACAHANAMPRASKATLCPTRAALLALWTIVTRKASALAGEAFAVTTGCARL